MRFIMLPARILFSVIFILSAINHFRGPTIEYAASAGVPYASILVPLSGVLALVGGLSVLIGYHTRIGAVLLILFLVPVTFMMHNFWDVPDAETAMTQQVHFLKNLSLIGGAAFLAYFGPGPFSVDWWRTGHHHAEPVSPGH